MSRTGPDSQMVPPASSVPFHFGFRSKKWSYCPLTRTFVNISVHRTPLSDGDSKHASTTALR